MNLVSTVKNKAGYSEVFPSVIYPVFTGLIVFFTYFDANFWKESVLFFAPHQVVSYLNIFLIYRLFVNFY